VETIIGVETAKGSRNSCDRKKQLWQEETVVASQLWQVETATARNSCASQWQSVKIAEAARNSCGRGEAVAQGNSYEEKKQLP
jgi:hypothetical protein